MPEESNFFLWLEVQLIVTMEQRQNTLSLDLYVKDNRVVSQLLISDYL